MQGKKSLPGAETGADARGGGQLRWKASRYSPLYISVFLILLLLHSNEGNYACKARRAYLVQRRGLMLGEGDNCDGRPADTLLSVFLFFLVLLLLFYSISVFRSLLLLAIMEREGSCWSRFERDSPLLLVLGERCCLELGLWRRRVTGGVVWSLFFLLLVGDGFCGCPRC